MTAAPAQCKHDQPLGACPKCRREAARVLPGPAPLQLEDAIQEDVSQFFRDLGFVVCSLSQGYRPGGKRHATTRQTKGLADLRLFHRARGIHADFEVKRPGEVLRPEQDWYRDLCAATDLPHGWGGVPEAKAFARSLGFKLGGEALSSVPASPHTSAREN